MRSARKSLNIGAVATWLLLLLPALVGAGIVGAALFRRKAQPARPATILESAPTEDEPRYRFDSEVDMQAPREAESTIPESARRPKLDLRG